MHTEKAEEVDEVKNNGLHQKKFVHDKWVFFRPKMAHPHNSGSALRNCLQFCRMKGANRYIKMLLVVFWEKKSFVAIWSY